MSPLLCIHWLLRKMGTHCSAYECPATGGTTTATRDLRPMGLQTTLAARAQEMTLKRGTNNLQCHKWMHTRTLAYSAAGKRRRCIHSMMRSDLSGADPRR